MDFTGLAKVMADYIDEKRDIKLTEFEKRYKKELQKVQENDSNSILDELTTQQNKEKEAINKKYSYLSWLNW